MTAPMPDIHANLERVREQIRTAAVAAGRRPEEIRLVAVSKYMPESYLREAMQAGQHVFGENTVQDALGKLRVLQEPGNEWHFIGHLQTNKAKHIPGNFSWLHTLDSTKLANRLARHCQETHSTLNILIQVNVSGDPDKHGLPAERLFGFTEELLEAGHAGLSLRGLMTIGSGASPSSAGVPNTRTVMPRSPCASSMPIANRPLPPLSAAMACGAGSIASPVLSRVMSVIRSPCALLMFIW